MSVKTVILNGGATWTVPADFVSLVGVHAIGGGCCGSPGFSGAVDLENLQSPTQTGGTFAEGYAGPGGWYATSANPTVPLAPGQVLACHVAAASPPVANLLDWCNDFFGAPPLSDDTWLQDDGGNYIVYAPGGDSNASDVGDVTIEGGSWNQTNPKLPSSAGGGAAGGPAGLPSFQTQDGAQSGFVNPTQIKLFGSGAGAGNLDHAAGLPGVGTRTAAGAGGGAGPSAGGAGGVITGAAAASSSLLLPSLLNPNTAADAVKASAGFLFGAGDFTVELLYQTPLDTPNRGILLSVWDRGTNQKSWALISGGAGAGWNDWVRSTTGANEIYGAAIGGLPNFATNTNLTARYTSGGFQYFGPYTSPLGWTHLAICREAGALRMFIDGYPSITEIAADISYTLADAIAYFASNAVLTIGGSLNNGAVDTTGGANGLFHPAPGWFGSMRITIGTARYTCAATSPTGPAPTFNALGQQFAVPAGPLLGGDFNCNWPGVKGATASVAFGALLNFQGAAQIDSDQYCFPPAVAEIGGDGIDGATGQVLWTDSVSAVTAGPGGGGGGGGGDVARYRMKTGGDGGAGGNYGGGGGEGGGVNSGLYVDLGDAAAAPGIGGAGAPGVLVIQYNGAAPAGLLAIAQVIG